MADRPLWMAHVETWRPYTAMYPGLVGAAGAALAGTPHATLIAAWLVPTLVWIAALYFGDHADRELDALTKPHRPLPSGRLSARAALVAGSGCAVTAGVVGLCVNWRSILVVAAGLVGVATYSRVLKARGFAGNANRGVLTAIALVFGAMTVQDWPPAAILPWALVFCAQDAASNLVGALRDVDGDRAGGYATMPVLRGVRVSRLAACGLYALAAVLAIASSTGDRHPDPVLLGGALLLGACAYGCLMLARGPVRRTALLAHEVLVVERVLLAVAVCTVSLEPPVVAALAVPSLVITLVSQHLLRHQHEFGTGRTTSS
ncbi:UbiA family prenyltransferase [Amycolatopsis sp. cg5]|uniref:UbiA family prenyltransferase n=1 Tax=Amycolatopsis sp. cg5 TaxID=3238802 RepID=UPI003525EAB3